jgi:hypothetical protein
MRFTCSLFPSGFLYFHIKTVWVINIKTCNNKYGTSPKVWEEVSPTESLNNKKNISHCPNWTSDCDLMLHYTLLRVYIVKQHCVGNNMVRNKIKQSSWYRLMASTTRVPIIFSIPFTCLVLFMLIIFIFITY